MAFKKVKDKMEWTGDGKHKNSRIVQAKVSSRYDKNVFHCYYAEKYVAQTKTLEAAKQFFDEYKA